MALMLGFSSPVPSTITSSPRKNTDCAVPKPSSRWPSAMITPPPSTARCAPSSRSAIQPPGTDSMYTAALYRP